MHPNLKAFLDTLATSELGKALLQVSDNGYNVIVGSTAEAPILFGSYADHPRKTSTLTIKSKTDPAVVLNIKSTAAGRYQILERFYDVYKKQLNLPDFSPDSQDAIALQLIKECKATEAIVSGRIDEAITKCASRWASLPGSGYGQHENKMSNLLTAFELAGGTLA